MIKEQLTLLSNPFCNTVLHGGMATDFQTSQGKDSIFKSILHVLTLVPLGAQHESQADENPYLVPESEGN